MTEERDPDRLADELAGEADHMQQRSEELQERITGVRDDWERKRADEGVPGAPPRPTESEPAHTPEPDPERET